MNHRRSTENDRGGIALLASLVLMVMIGMGALVIDGGYLAMRRRNMQAVADAAALAGAVRLPTSATAISDARANATQNGYTNGASGATVTVNSPYLSNTNAIEVIVQMNVSTFLGKALKINTGLVKGRAVVNSTQAAVVFSGDSVCADPGDNLVINGSDSTFSGGIHSNSSLQFGANAATTAGSVEYGNACLNHNVGGPTIASGPTNVPNQAYPITWTFADFCPCVVGPTCFKNTAGVWNLTSSAGSWWAPGNGPNTGTLNPGVYCSTGGGGIQINGGPVNGNVTFVSDGPIQINGNVLNFVAFRNNVFLFSTMATTTVNAIQLGNQTVTWAGTIFAPNGLITINGQDFIGSGGIVGKRIQLGPTRWTMTGGVGPTGQFLSE